MAQATKPGLIVSTPSDLEITMTRTFEAPAQLVFDAWTRPEHVRRWFGPRDWTIDVCDIDLRVGGKWRFHMRRGDEQMGLYGEYLEIGPPGRLVNTELFEEPYFEEMGAGTINTLILTEDGGVTTMEATSLYKSKEQRDTVLATGFEEGAGESFDRMAELLQTLTA
jgi:uncharacterized protein YndB with AHSA1/START domain